MINQQKGKKKHKKTQRSGTCLYHIRPRSFFLIVVVIDTFAEINIIFLIGYLAETVISLLLNLSKMIELIQKKYFHRYWKYKSQN